MTPSRSTAPDCPLPELCRRRFDEIDERLEQVGEKLDQLLSRQNDFLAIGGPVALVADRLTRLEEHVAVTERRVDELRSGTRMVAARSNGTPPSASAETAATMIRSTLGLPLWAWLLLAAAFTALGVVGGPTMVERILGLGQ